MPQKQDVFRGERELGRHAGPRAEVPRRGRQSWHHLLFCSQGEADASLAHDSRLVHLILRSRSPVPTGRGSCLPCAKTIPGLTKIRSPSPLSRSMATRSWLSWTTSQNRRGLSVPVFPLATSLHVLSLSSF